MPGRFYNKVENPLCLIIKKTIPNVKRVPRFDGSDEANYEATNKVYKLERHSILKVIKRHVINSSG